ncbi:MAG: hypothetical protein E7662_11715 [Ruminococcaceae bacterium]|nr:hypothetical protein [Oscillospiraceae bacterium]
MNTTGGCAVIYVDKEKSIMTDERIAALQAKIAALDAAEFGPFVTEEMRDPKRAWCPPAQHPECGMHPRLLLRREDIPGIIAAMKQEENMPAAAEFNRLADTECDGILPPAWNHETGRKGDYNFDYNTLAVIQAKALRYLITGDALAGYEAVYAMLNFIRTMEIKWIICDHCREYGFAGYIAACTYDWCYDLMDADSRFKMIAGLEHRFFRGSVPGSPTALCGTVKMEAGFPPFGQGVCTGHGSEMQILRDYLAVSAAIYDEYPGWWDFIAGRVYNEYVPVRNVYYRSGIVPQGAPGYATWRYLGDMFSAWILKSVIGVSPYMENMKEVARSFIARETVGGDCLRTGDIYSTKVTAQMGGAALITDYLYGDSTLRAWARKQESGFSKFTAGVANILPAEFLILSGHGQTCAADHRSGLSKITYNPYPLGEIIARNAWDCEDTLVVQMKIGERSTGNHDHADSGHFQIYYKGMLADDTGYYGRYGSDHHFYYHKATVAHNSLLIYNPGCAAGELTYDANGRPNNRYSFWYSGGQRIVGETPFLHTWMTPEFDFGTVHGVDYSLKADGTPDYVYIAGNFAQAYPAGTAEYVGRSMLTVYTGDAVFPAVMFVSDRIDAAEPSFKKTFLLQCCSEPVIDETAKTVRTTNGKASLFLRSIAGGDEIKAFGGKDQDFWISAKNVNLPHPSGDPSWHWGHLEISPAAGSKSDLLMHVLTVADGQPDTAPAAEAIRGDGVQGVRQGNICAVFTTGTSAEKKEVSFTAAGGSNRFFIGGLAAGTWKICVNGTELSTKTVSRESGMLVFEAAGGRVTVTR